MSDSLKPLAKGATPDLAQLAAELDRTCRVRPKWLLDTRTALDLGIPEMAALMGAPSVRTYQRWQKRPWTMPVWAYLRAKAALDAHGVDSFGRMLAAKVAG